MDTIEKRIQAYLKKVGQTNKVNLEKVQLSMVSRLSKKADELAAAQKRLKKFELDIETFAVKKIRAEEELSDLARKAKEEVKEGRNEIKEGKDFLREAKAMAKELGVDPNKIEKYDLLEIEVEDTETEAAGVLAMLKTFNVK
jgi:predicted transcriptional regulator